MTLSFLEELRRGQSRNATAEVSRMGNGIYSRFEVLPGVHMMLSE